jgi:hypothetical protein
MHDATGLELEDRRHAVELAYSRYMRAFRAHAAQRELDQKRVHQTPLRLRSERASLAIRERRQP